MAALFLIPMTISSLKKKKKLPEGWMWSCHHGKIWLRARSDRNLQSWELSANGLGGMYVHVFERLVSFPAGMYTHTHSKLCVLKKFCLFGHYSRDLGPTVIFFATRCPVLGVIWYFKVPVSIGLIPFLEFLICVHVDHCYYWS